MFLRRFLSGIFTKTSSKQDDGIKRIELTLVRFAPEPISVTSTVDSTNEALRWLDLATEDECFIEASAWKGKFSLGDFRVWCSGDFACAHIAEHRRHDARYLDVSFVAPDNFAVKDDDGSIYHPPQELICRDKLQLMPFALGLSIRNVHRRSIGINSFQ